MVISDLDECQSKQQPSCYHYRGAHYGFGGACTVTNLDRIDAADGPCGCLGFVEVEPVDSSDQANRRIGAPQ